MNNLETATLAGGCFWCLEAAYQQIKGVESVDSGYCGGTNPNPSYESSNYHNTGEAETVQVHYDPKVISYDEILEIFWALHDPTTPNRQGNDAGPQYRSVIFYHNDAQKAAADKSKAEVAKLWPDPILTEIVAFEKFYPAEEYHRNYFKLHPEQAYCQIVINPKLEKLKQKFAAKLK
jgi:peptide-methionine (S)-S-oxide reductase